MNKGIFYAATAYLLWGLLPIFWKGLQGIPPYEILCHRMTWSLPFVLGILIVRRQWKWISKAIFSPRVMVVFLLTSLLIGANWFTYVYAVTSGFVIESSLGYFINPLLYVLLGVIFLKEKLRLWQIIAIAIAALGVVFLTFIYGSFPWIGLILAFTFGLYGLLRKTAPLEALEGLTLETGILFLPSLALLIILEMKGTGSLGHVSLSRNLLLILTGAVTSFPLLLFALGARRITLINLGFLQYIAPTLQFLIGVLIYREYFGGNRLLGFCIIWFALAIYLIDLVIYWKRRNHPVR
ncbi:MAG: EamA family transporter RarD [Candidatus Cloacimonetes bacterium]|nr:EamA family transporter RarD [Candidatus Cloacimonadota bacterium]